MCVCVLLAPPLRHKLDTWRVVGEWLGRAVEHHTVPNFFLASDKLPYSSIISIRLRPW